MIKATMTLGGKPTVLLGLTGENMTRLMSDEPMMVELDELDLPPIRVVLMGGKSEEHMKQQLVDAGLLTDQTEVR